RHRLDVIFDHVAHVGRSKAVPESLSSRTFIAFCVALGSLGTLRPFLPAKAAVVTGIADTNTFSTGGASRIDARSSRSGSRNRPKSARSRQVFVRGSLLVMAPLLTRIRTPRHPRRRPVDSLFLGPIGDISCLQQRWILSSAAELASSRFLPGDARP